ncbi:hypothetical protein [Absidia glauca]|uniref:Ndc10 domain-containing protein n=1 Tax=Absidia glauca TaxID=4829 RepID=A0A163J3S7_ABSGL|nr:hypothetical protein [Absidia glauca]
MRSVTGFPTNGRFFYLACAALDPPTSLYKKLFLAIDEWHDRLAAKELGPDNNDPGQATVNANAFGSAPIKAQEHDPAHPLVQQCVPMHSRFQPPIGYKKFSLARPSLLLLLPLVIPFLPHCHLFFTPRRQTNERTSTRTNER